MSTVYGPGVEIKAESLLDLFKESEKRERERTGRRPGSGGRLFVVIMQHTERLDCVCMRCTNSCFNQCSVPWPIVKWVCDK